MKKRRDPLIKRIPRELIGDWRKYLVVSLFMILVIGFVSGMYVANESMMTAAENGIEEYMLEDGHFELTEKADEELLSAIASGEKADVKSYYTGKAKTELDGEFKENFDTEFKSEFDSKFSEKFDDSFASQVKDSLMAQGLDEETADSVLPSYIEMSKESGDYQTAYDSAYGEAYEEAYSEAYQSAYDEAWAEIKAEIDEKYADAVEKYQLEDADWSPVPVSLYENFYKDADEDNDNDGISDGTVRLYVKNDSINLASLMEGRLPEAADEVAIDRMHADNSGISVGDYITVGSESYQVVGLIAYVNYSCLFEKNTDMMFDALKFDVAMVTEDGFERISTGEHYSYAWQYEVEPSDEKEEKRLSDEFLQSLVTQTVVYDNDIEDYLPGYANQAIHFATDDMGGDIAMGGVLLDILIVIIAFIFAVTISNTISRESKTIGTLRASGYTRGELICHYLTMPVIVTIVSAAVGNVLGYTLFKNVVVSMYYESYSLPKYETLWNTDALIKTTLIPIALMFIVNLAVISGKMRHTPLEFLRSDLKKNGGKKAVRLPKVKFFSRFRMRIIIQNAPNYVILFFGIFFVSVMLAMAVGMPETLDYYKENAESMMLSKYQYVLKSCEDEDGETITTANEEAEQFCITSLKFTDSAIDEEISVYGIGDDSRYVALEGIDASAGDEVMISTSFGEKYSISVGDTVTLDEKYENKQYTFTVAGLYYRSQSLAVFMPSAQFVSVFDMSDGEFSGYMSDTEITDIPDDSVATVITERDITKICDQLDHSMGSYMQYFQVMCIILSAVMIYLLSKIIIEKNENSISMTKILGYENGEIGRLYLISTAVMLVIFDAVSVFLGSAVMSKAWEAVMAQYSGWYPFKISALGYAKMFIFILISYLVVMVFDFRRIKNIPMDKALKNAE